MDFDLWRVFLKVNEHGSLSRAAIALDTTQPVLSRQLSSLEKQCGGALFHRTGRGVTLTDLGAGILPRVAALVGEAAEIAEDVRSAAGIATGNVRLGLIGSLGEPLITELVRNTQKRLPRVRLNIVEAMSGYLERWLADGVLDLAIVLRGERRRTDHTLLASADFHLVGPPGDSITSSSTVPFVRLAGLPLILPERPNNINVLLDQIARQHGIRLNIATEVDSLVIQKSLAAAGLGYCVLIRHGLGREIAAKTLQVSQIVRPKVSREIVLAVSTHRPQTSATREVSKLIKEVAVGLVKSELWKTSDRATNLKTATK